MLFRNLKNLTFSILLAKKNVFNRYKTQKRSTMKIQPIYSFQHHSNYENKNCNYVSLAFSAPSMTGNFFKAKKSSLLKKMFRLITNKKAVSNEIQISPSNTNLKKILSDTSVIEVKNQRAALDTFLRDKSFSKKVQIKNKDNSSIEIFYRKFDPVVHDDRIFADYFDSAKKLVYTTVYDSNGLKLSQYYVKFNNPKEPISIRRKDFNVAGKLIHEEIKYKNGDVTNVDYDLLHKIQRFETLRTDGSKKVLTMSEYSCQTQEFDKLGNEISNDLTTY